MMTTDHAEVDDVSAVAAGVAVRQLHHGGEHALAGVFRDDAAAAVELAGHGEGDEHRERDGHQRIEVRDILPGLEAESRAPTLRRDHQEDGDRDGADGRPQEVALQAFERGLTPSQQRAHGGENQKQQGHRDGHAVVVRRRYRDFLFFHEFGEFREPGSQEHDDAENHEKQVVEQEAGLARHDRFELVLALQV